MKVAVTETVVCLLYHFFQCSAMDLFHPRRLSRIEFFIALSFVSENEHKKQCSMHMFKPTRALTILQSVHMRGLTSASIVLQKSIRFIEVIIQLRVQFGINLHE